MTLMVYVAIKILVKILLEIATIAIPATMGLDSDLMMGPLKEVMSATSVGMKIALPAASQ
jgi:hypothetical protein